MTSPMRISALHDAILGGNVGKVKLLLKSGAPADSQYNGETFAQTAARSGSIEILDLLTAAGAELDGSLLTPALQGNVSNRGPMVRKILEAGKASREQVDEALMWAVESSPAEVVQQLLDAGANPSLADETGSTPLMQAVYFDNEPAAVLLLKRGASSEIRVPYEDFYKLTIREMIEAKGLRQCVAALADVQPKTAATPAVPRNLPTTIVEFWKAIDDSIAGVAGDYEPGPPVESVRVDDAIPPLPDDFLASLDVHDGSNGWQVLPMPNDVSHTLYSLAESLSQRRMMLEVYAGEEPPDEPALKWWRPEWLPISTNGAGDYLILDARDGVVYYFSHETRLKTFRAPSFFDLLRDAAVGVLTGKYSYTTQHGLA